MTATSALIVHWLGFAFTALAMLAALAIATARAHFAICVYVAVTSVLAALAALCFGAGAAALAIALVGVGIVPILMLGGVLLSTRAIRKVKTGRQFFIPIAAGFAALALIWGTLDATPAQNFAQPLGVGAWLSPLLMLAGFVCTGLLGYGERGALAHPRDGREP